MMLPKHWHHGHSLLSGLLAGIILMSYREWLLVGLAFAGGAIFALLLERGARLVRWLSRSVPPLTMRRWKALRRRVDVLRPDDEIPF